MHPQNTHQGWDIAGEPITHHGPRDACWDPACERSENYVALDDLIDIEAGLQAILDSAGEV